MNCQYQLTYDELILGTHELDDCMFMKIVCEGCGQKISKNDQIRHDTIECSNPHAKCKFCKQITHIHELVKHQANCEKRAFVKLEYNDPDQGAGLLLQENPLNSIERLNQEFAHRLHKLQNRSKVPITSGTSVAGKLHRSKEQFSG